MQSEGLWLLVGLRRLCVGENDEVLLPGRFLATVILTDLSISDSSLQPCPHLATSWLRQHAAHLLPTVDALTFSAIIVRAAYK